MAKKPKTRKRTVYRDKKTGRFASKASWKRSTARGGKRFVRQIERGPTRPVRSRERPSRRAARPRGRSEYQINIRYDAGKESNKVEVQISAKGPSGRTRDQVLNAVEKKMKNAVDEKEDDDGEVLNPRGWEIHIVFWEKRGKQFFGDDAQAWRQLNLLFEREEVEVHEVR
jgi:hypothetical protein